MKFVKPPRVRFYGFFASMPLITFTWAYILYGDRLYHEWKLWAVTFALVYGIGIVSWYLHEVYDAWLRRKYPSLEQTRKRVLYKSAVNLLVMTPSCLFIFWFFDAFHIMGYSLSPGDLKYGCMVGLAINIIFETLWEVLYIIEKNKESAAEKMMLEEMHLRQEFENLKQKVNPHFLFNCFNTLSSLITEDRQQAERFLDELSKVYRYLLRSNENGMSTLDQEVKFIRSYYRLLHTRYGDGLKMDLQVHPMYLQAEMPALSLQLLVENAVKHNVISKQHPLHVVIRTTPEACLVVENNLAQKINRSESTGIGLANIREKYRLLNKGSILIQKYPDRFVVSLPLEGGVPNDPYGAIHN